MFGIYFFMVNKADSFSLAPRLQRGLVLVLLGLCVHVELQAQQPARTVELFTQGWKFYLGDIPQAKDPGFADQDWRRLDLPHDWSIELPFDSTSPTGNGGGALRGGIGWYRKTFTLPGTAAGKNIFIDFDGIYCNSEVWINGHLLGLRPNGYISFRYDLTPYVKFAGKANVISVKVDNSLQPNSRWYSGSGIYRNVWLVTTHSVFVDQWGTCITTPQVSHESAQVLVRTSIRSTPPAGLNVDTAKPVSVRTTLYDSAGHMVASAEESGILILQEELIQQMTVNHPSLWSMNRPYLYKSVTQVLSKGTVVDEYVTRFGIRYFAFDSARGFSLNGKRIKIFGVCDHHDLGCLGTAINTRALQRQLEILKRMGVNGIRTSHNPPAPELLDLADQMGFIVMDEAFDMWKKPKTTYDYHLNWDVWHRKDLEDQVLRDRNHPCVFIWSIGNEIPEQAAGKDGRDSSGRMIARELADIIRNLDRSRPISSALDQPYPQNQIYQSGALDLVGYNYHQNEYKNFPSRFPGQRFIATETVSALQTRGRYDMPSDLIRRWPVHWDKPMDSGNPDLSCSAYDNCSAPWGSTHEETLKQILKYDFASGQFIWTGFDYIGEPTPYPWPARSSYFGIVDLAGFPKDVYYLYQSQFTQRTVLHIFPHWNWNRGDTVDVWAYYNHADQVELFLNGKSLGLRKKQGDQLHVSWRVVYVPGTLRAISRLRGTQVMTTEVKTAGAASKIKLTADRSLIQADGKDLSFVTVSITDGQGNLVPSAGNEVHFKLEGPGFIAGVDNGSQTSLESFKADQRAAFNGLCLAVIQSTGQPGPIQLRATSDGLAPASLIIEAK
jgi:beta-galactosidase